MKKQVTLTICDICEEQLEKNEKSKICNLCGKEVCENCHQELFDEEELSHSLNLVVCEKCFDENSDVADEVIKFFRKKEVKAKFKLMREDLKEYLKQVIMLRNLGDKNDK